MHPTTGYALGWGQTAELRYPTQRDQMVRAARRASCMLTVREAHSSDPVSSHGKKPHSKGPATPPNPTPSAASARGQLPTSTPHHRRSSCTPSAASAAWPASWPG
jgi:hypothetical protein